MPQRSALRRFRFVNLNVLGENIMSILHDLGYGPFFSAQVELLAPGSAFLPARVSSESRGIYQLVGCSATLGTLSGKLLSQLRAIDRPTVGDWLAVSVNGERAVIQHVLDRRTLLKRRAADTEATVQPIAANVDRFFIVTSANHELNPRRLERYLAAVWESDAEPVIVLNKIDLVRDASSMRASIESVAPQVRILAVSALTGTGVRELEALLEPGKTVGLIGSSGVGKSSLTNSLLGHESMATAEVGWEAKGRHTTTHKQLVILPGRGVLLDTPGLRELGLVGDASGLGSAFVDIQDVGAGCRFRDCQHEREPGCAVLAAIEAGVLTEERLRSYHKLGRELRAAQQRRDPALMANAKRRWKAIAKSNRKRTRSED